MNNMILAYLVLYYLKLFHPRKMKFKLWAQSEELAQEISKLMISGDNFSGLVFDYVRMSLHIPQKIMGQLPWEIALTVYSTARHINTPNKLPLLASSGKVKDKEVGWNYKNRNWHYWSHLLAKEYGWTLDEISNMEVDVALPHIQEILTDEQLHREFLWGMSEIAYPYNASIKQSVFKPLPRPYFMAEEAPKIKQIRIPSNLMPSGIINDSGGMMKYFEDKNKTTLPS